MQNEASGWVGDWSPGIGDPTPAGWITVGLYVLAAVASGFAAARARTDDNRSSFIFWAVLTALYAFLGLNKQLDLQSLMTESARLLAHAGGWYERRRLLQLALIAGLIVAGAAGLVGLGFTAPWRSAARTIALCGTTFLVAFVVIRAASFHQVDRLLGSTWLGLRANWILEMPGILLAAAGGWLAGRRGE